MWRQPDQGASLTLSASGQPVGCTERYAPAERPTGGHASAERHPAAGDTGTD
jgi:hypothetical protein